MPEESDCIGVSVEKEVTEAGGEATGMRDPLDCEQVIMRDIVNNFESEKSENTVKTVRTYRIGVVGDNNQRSEQDRRNLASTTELLHCALSKLRCSRISESESEGIGGRRIGRS